jgi:hypothetical protein
MSFLSDLIHGNTGNLGHDLFGSPTAIAETVGGVLGLGGLGLGAAGLLGLGGVAADAGAIGAGAPLDLLAGGAAAGTAGADAAAGGLDLTALGLTSDASSAFAADPGIQAIDAFAPLGTTSGAAADTAAQVGTLSVPGIADSSVAASDITNFAPGATDATGGSTGGGSFLDKLVSGASNSLTKNPLGIAAATGGLGLSLLRGNQTDPNQQALQNEAPGLAAQGAALTQSGQQLQTYLTSGTLPPALQSQVSSAVAAEKARIIQNHASNGENTNPSQNSALAQELSQADINGINLGGQLEQQLFTAGTQLLNTGLNETGLSTQLYETLAKMDQTNNNQLMASIASMAAALGGGTKIQIGGTSAAA